MALKVKCKCGTALKVPSAMADKKITCPGCEKSFVIPSSRFSAATKPVKVATAPAAAIAAPEPKTAPPKKVAPVAKVPASDVMPASLDDELSSLTLLEHAESSADLLYGLSGENSPSVPAADPPLPAIQVERVAASVGYAQDRAIRGGSTSKITGVIEGPKRNYWTDAFFSFIYPFRSGGNIVSFVVISFVTLLLIPLTDMGGFFIIPSFIIFGWIRAMYLQVVQDTAAGSDDLPGIRMEDGFMEDIIKPAIRYIGAYACALLPALCYLIAVASGALPKSMVSPIVFFLWLAAGIFLWPFFVMLFSFDAVAHIVRIDLMFTTIFRTLLPYLALWVMLMLVGFLSILPLVGAIVAIIGLNINIPEIPMWGGLVGNAVMRILDVYFSIVSMRIIGLYYLHYKSRFTLEFE